jgi:putative ubiquitin-RnfH superfamily antitoxin RatB of RatAB toxin-antitoxin module
VAEETMRVEVAYAELREQLILELECPVDTTAAQAVELSGIRERFPGIDLKKNKLGVFGKMVKADAKLNPGDRVEIYRPLIADPKEARKKRAAEGKAMKNRTR